MAALNYVMYSRPKSGGAKENACSGYPKWDLVTQMYSYYTKPDKAVVTDVAKKLVQKYPFMRDDGPKVSGYVCGNLYVSIYRH